MFPHLVILLIFASKCHTSSSLLYPNLTVGAFNIKVFGPTKASNDYVMNLIKEIILDYDVMLVQEIRDISQNAMEELYRRLNGATGVKFSYIKSDRLGRSNRKEQYAYYYRSDKLDIVGTFQYSDANDVFEREPFSVLVRVPLPNENVFNMALIGLHVKPSTAVEEINQLDEVCEEVKSKLFTDNVVIMGDLNADCNYADDGDLNRTAVFADSNFKSMIDNDADTTTFTTTHCAYDRIIVSGSELRSKRLLAEVDRFDTRLGLTYTETKSVSDHYPVKLTVML